MFFDNWRVQAASVNLLDDNMSQSIDKLEAEYAISSEERQQQIFNEYCMFSIKIQENLCNFLKEKRNARCSVTEDRLWQQIIKLYPYLSDIKDSGTRKAILCCKTEDEIRQYISHQTSGKTLAREIS